VNYILIIGDIELECSLAAQRAYVGNARRVVVSKPELRNGARHNLQGLTDCPQPILACAIDHGKIEVGRIAKLFEVAQTQRGATLEDKTGGRL
jgi:hypothetical protein